MSDTTTLDLSYGAILGRAAELIETNGIARNDYYTPEGLDDDPRACAVCVLGAIAVAAGFHPDTWNSPTADLGEFRPVREVADLLIDRLALDPVVAWDESIGRWSDEHSDEHVVATLRDIAAEQAQNGGEAA
ncbi:hypothetical protein ACBJ59_10975 [Nonomuraea sp. MTCD27]|uniref:DUF6197 family protein n=1 Tax=Nonomuraea sp. MTCD27 TaxID=1676747 RepID=UPI0035C01C3D